MPQVVKMPRRYIATMSLIIRHAGRPDLRVQMVLFPDDDWMTLLRVSHKMIRRARILDPDFRLDEAHWRVAPHAI